MDTASPAPEFLRPWGRNTQRVRDPTHVDAIIRRMLIASPRFGVGFLAGKSGRFL
jgi:hypothetical protein